MPRVIDVAREAFDEAARSGSLPSTADLAGIPIEARRVISEGAARIAAHHLSGDDYAARQEANRSRFEVGEDLAAVGVDPFGNAVRRGLDTATVQALTGEDAR